LPGYLRARNRTAYSEFYKSGSHSSFKPEWEILSFVEIYTPTWNYHFNFKFTFQLEIYISTWNLYRSMEATQLPPVNDVNFNFFSTVNIPNYGSMKPFKVKKHLEKTFLVFFRKMKFSINLIAGIGCNEVSLSQSWTST
jgi:hypothetical protein